MNSSRRSSPFSFVATIAAGLLLALFGLIGNARAAAPSLSEVEGNPLRSVYRAGESYTLRLRYTDPDGDPPRSGGAKFFDESPAGNQTIDGKIGSGDPRNGVIIEWEVRGFAEGAHNNTRFEVRNRVGEVARFPADPNTFYSFVAESLVSKLVIMGIGLLIGLLFVPFLFYLLFRAMNRRGDPSRAARVGLLIGLLACVALFIYLFASFYGPLVYAIGGVAALALLVIVLTRR